MGRSIDYHKARELLIESFSQAERDFQTQSPTAVSEKLSAASSLLFASTTQAFREALVGCALARSLDQSIDIRLPYLEQGSRAFSGRQLDQQVVNPFFQERQIPCSQGPYLSVLRRKVRFDKATREGVRDKAAYDALLSAIAYLEKANDAHARNYLRHLLFEFVKLREASKITLMRVRHLSVEQFGQLFSTLLSKPSGGAIPVLLVLAMFEAIAKHFNLDWAVEFQGINVPDRASGAGGDIVIRRGGRTILAVEVTERPIGRARVVATFNAKISPQGIQDYLFFFSQSEPASEARGAARQYFAQGHEINFVRVQDWLVSALTTLGRDGRSVYLEELLALLGRPDTAASIKVFWNEALRGLVR